MEKKNETKNLMQGKWTQKQAKMDDEVFQSRFLHRIIKKSQFLK